MIESQKEAILISFLNEKEKYKKLAEYVLHLIQDDPFSPKESLHTIVYRIKDELRLIEKIEKINLELEVGEVPISEKNFQVGVRDLLGIRIICLRLSDIVKIQEYLQLLSEEKILNFLKGPDQKKSFILPVAPGESIPDDLDLRYSGYSSVHYQIELSENLDVPQALKGLQFELQLRTILEEAWSEIDHKYRYAQIRTGENLPEHIHMGFYYLSAYLQVAALQAENLCRMAETQSLEKNTKAKNISRILLGDKTSSTDMKKNVAYGKLSISEIEKNIKRILGFKVKPRTLIYIEKRLAEINTEEKPVKTIQKLLSKNRLAEFKNIFQETLNFEPFASDEERDIDAINALNFAIFNTLQGKRVALEGLRAVLRWRKGHSKSYA